MPTRLRALRLRRRRRRRAPGDPAAAWIVLGAVLATVAALAWAVLLG